MLLTKGYFKRFQYWVVALCIISASLIGSLQTLFIIHKILKK